MSLKFNKSKQIQKMKSKSLLFFITVVILLQIGCKKDTNINTFKFTSITGLKSGASGIISFTWSDSQNSNWDVEVKNSNGTTRNKFNVADIESQVVLGLDSTYTIGVTGGTKPRQSGSFNARIATTGDVLINQIKP